MSNFLRNLSLFSILTITILLIASAVSLSTSFISLRDSSQYANYKKNDMLSTNYINTLEVSFKLVTSPLNYGREYITRYSIFNSTLNDFIELSSLKETSISSFISSLSLYYVVKDIDRARYEDEGSRQLNRTIFFTDYTNNNSVVRSSVRDTYCPVFFTTPLSDRFIPGLDICNIGIYKQSIIDLLSSPTQIVVSSTRMDQKNITLLDFATNTPNGLVVVTLIIENIINVYVSNDEKVSIRYKRNNIQVFTNCINHCESLDTIDKDLNLPNGDVLIFTFFFIPQSLDITTFLFILLGIVIIVSIILFIIFNFEIQKSRYILADKMLGYVNHEIRNPLNCINGLIDLSLVQYEEDALINTNIDREIETDLNTAKIACDLLGHIVNDILDLKSINNGKLVINRENINVTKFVEILKRILSTRINENPEVKFKVINEDKIKTIYFDEQRLLQVLINFTTNAIKFTTSGSITLLIENKPGSVSDLERGSNTNKIRISVIDTGKGIKKEEYKNIFKPFEQNNLNKNVGGIGLGLYLCKMIMDQSEGKIGFESVDGTGSTFYIEFYNKSKEVV